MGHHIDDQGRFQSDRHPDLAPDKIVLSFRDPAAKAALRQFCHLTEDPGLARDIVFRLQTLEREEAEKARSDAR